MFEFDAEKRKPADGLFLERLDAFMDRSMSDLKAFADRESLSLEEVVALRAICLSWWLNLPLPRHGSMSRSGIAGISSSPI